MNSKCQNTEIQQAQVVMITVCALVALNGVLKSLKLA